MPDRGHRYLGERARGHDRESLGRTASHQGGDVVSTQPSGFYHLCRQDCNKSTAIRPSRWVSKNPYQLATDIFGIGFVTADTIARNIGIAPDSAFRYCAGKRLRLQQAAEEGHCYLPGQELIERVVKRLALPDSPVDPVRIGELIVLMTEDKQLITQPGYGDLAEELLCYAPASHPHRAGSCVAPGCLCQGASLS